MTPLAVPKTLTTDNLAILSSNVHVQWSLRLGGWLGVGDDSRYLKIKCFDPFPFPDLIETVRANLRTVGEELDATRKRVQAEHPDLTLTGLYNVMERIRVIEAAERDAPGLDAKNFGRAAAIRDTSGEERPLLTAFEEDVKSRGLVLILSELHEEIDRLTAQAYGWPADLSDEAILERLVALNAERAREETTGHVRWLRPDYQIPRFAKGAPAKTGELALDEKVVAIDKSKPVFPADRYEQPLAVEAMLLAAGRPMGAAEIARGFRRGGNRIEKRVVQVLTTLVRYGRITAAGEDLYIARRAA